MFGMMKFEYLKIWRRPVTKVLIGFSFAFTIIILGVLFSLGTSAYDQSGRKCQGIEAIQLQKEYMNRQKGILTEEKIQQIIGQYTETTANLDNSSQEKYYYDMQNSEQYWKDIQPNYPIYEWIASVYTGTYSSTVDLRILTEAAQGSLSFYEARNKKVQEIITGINNANQHTQVETVYWQAKNQTVKEPYEYGDYIGWQKFFEGNSVWYLSIFIICICVTHLFTMEKKTKFEAILLTTKYGRTRIVTAKIGAALLFGTGLYALNTLLAVGVTFLFWGVDGWNLPVQIYSATIPYSLSFAKAFLLLISINYLILIAMISVTMLLSAKAKSSFQVLVILGAVMLVPSFLEYSATSKFYNHILVLLPGQATAFANILQQYISYDIAGKIVGLPYMICIIYLLIFVGCIWGTKCLFRRQQVS